MIRWNSLFVWVLVISLLLGILPGCATLSPSLKSTRALENPCDEAAKRKDQLWKTLGGGAVGGIVGAGLGALLDKWADTKDHRYLKLFSVAGAGVGAAYGYFETADLYRRQCELQKIANANQLEAAFQTIELYAQDDSTDVSIGNAVLLASLDLPATDVHDWMIVSTNSQKGKPPSGPQTVGGMMTLPGRGHFRVGSSVLTREASNYFAALAQQYLTSVQEKGLDQYFGEGTTRKLSRDSDSKIKERWEGLRIVLVGHTDDTGPPELNAKLSEQRARSVADVFRMQGIPSDHLYYQGAGSSQPVADNRTAAGREKNRRVEIAEVQGNEGLGHFSGLRQPNPDFFRPKPEGDLKQDSNTAGAGVEAPPIQADQGQSETVARDTEEQKLPTSPDGNTRPRQPLDPARKTPRIGDEKSIDFGGTPAGEAKTQSLAALVGKPKPSGTSWGFVRTAVAGEKVYEAPCTRDDPDQNLGLPLKGLRTDKSVEATRTRDFLPGLYGTSWTDTLNGHLVAFTGVFVLRNGGAPGKNPNFLVYRDFQANPSKNASPSQNPQTRVKTYQGTSGLLYRVFFDGASSLRCADVVFPHAAPFEARGGNLYYQKENTIFITEFKPHVVK